MNETKFIISEKQILNAVKYALELNIQEQRIVDILMHDVEDEIETVLYDDCEPSKAESEIADAVVKKMQEPILDKVIEDIKTEIEECWQMYEDRFDVGDCLDIIDKHISGKES